MELARAFKLPLVRQTLGKVLAPGKMEKDVVRGGGDSMVALPLSPDVTVDCSVGCKELEVRLKLHKLFQNHPLPLSSLHPFMPSVVTLQKKGGINDWKEMTRCPV